MSKKPEAKQQDQKKIEELRQAKKRKKQLKQQQQRQKKLKQEQAIIDKEVQLIYQSGLADAYKYVIQQAFKEQVKFNIFEFAAQKILKYEKNKKEKQLKLNNINNKV